MTAPLMIRLRDSIWTVHARVEGLPYFRALHAGTLPLEAYVGHLRALAVLHALLERQLASTPDPSVRAVWSDGLRRFARLQADLDHFAPLGLPDIAPAQRAVLALGDRLLRRSMEDPASLLGYLYLLEGSVRGATVLGPLFAEAYGIQREAGASYFRWSTTEVEARWRSFTTRMDALDLAPRQAEAIAEAAREAFEGLEQVLAALHPHTPEHLVRTAAGLNPEAGSHAVPQDPAVLAAARRAGARCWEAFPYLAWRYGERGLRFTHSDSAWLATLPGLEPALAQAQVDWLVSVLAARGMPSLLLHQHLVFLHEELQGVPAAGAEGPLAAAAERLLAARRAHIPDAGLRALEARFAREARATGAAQIPEAAALVAWAVADRAGAHPQAVASLLPWLMDPRRFPPGWVAAVEGVLQDAEALVAGASPGSTMATARTGQPSASA